MQLAPPLAEAHANFAQEQAGQAPLAHSDASGPGCRGTPFLGAMREPCLWNRPGRRVVLWVYKKLA
jgi:hypothetical protein